MPDMPDLPKAYCSCGAVATWMYIPESKMACADCVPRGCGCNLELIDGIKPILIATDDPEVSILSNPAEDFEEHFDFDGRRIPCIDWIQCIDGFEQGFNAKQLIEESAELEDIEDDEESEENDEEPIIDSPNGPEGAISP